MILVKYLWRYRMKKNLLFVFLMLFLIFQLPVNTYAIDASSVIGKRVQVGDNCYAYVEDLVKW